MISVCISTGCTTAVLLQYLLLLAPPPTPHAVTPIFPHFLQKCTAAHTESEAAGDFFLSKDFFSSPAAKVLLSVDLPWFLCVLKKNKDRPCTPSVAAVLQRSTPRKADASLSFQYNSDLNTFLYFSSSDSVFLAGVFYLMEILNSCCAFMRNLVSSSLGW